MRKTSFVKGLICLVAAAFSLGSCSDLFQTGTENGKIVTRFVRDISPLTKSSALPDTNEFILQVTDSKNNIIYKGAYGAAPESIVASPGNYTVSAVSSEFSVPAFDSPQYGDTQVAVVSAGKPTTVELCCRQTNAGVRLNIKSSFLEAYPSGILYLKSSSGKLMYAYKEKRIAYFLPGSVSLSLSDEGKEKSLLTRTLSAQEILSLTVSASAGQQQDGNGIKIQVDTTRNWSSDNYVIGGDNAGGSPSSAYSVSQARNHAGESDVWVYGYIVGGDLSSSKCSFTGPFSSKTNVALAAKSSCTDKASCISVQLSQGDVRNSLNLVDHPDNLGRQVYLKGDIVPSYYGITGIQNISEFKFK